MKRLSTLAILLLTFPAMAGEDWAGREFGQNKILCTSDAGTEIKDYFTYEAPPGKFFTSVEMQEVVPTVSYAGGRTGCSRDGGERYAKIPVTLADGSKATIDRLIAFSAFAHADCGSGVGPVVSRWTITAVCRAVGKISSQ